MEGLDAPFSNSKLRCKPFADRINYVFFMYRLSGRSSAYRIQINKPKCSSPKDHNIITKALPQHHNIITHSETPPQHCQQRGKTSNTKPGHRPHITKTFAHNPLAITKTSPKHTRNITNTSAFNLTVHHRWKTILCAIGLRK